MMIYPFIQLKILFTLLHDHKRKKPIFSLPCLHVFRALATAVSRQSRHAVSAAHLKAIYVVCCVRWAARKILTRNKGVDLPYPPGKPRSSPNSFPDSRNMVIGAIGILIRPVHKRLVQNWQNILLTMCNEAWCKFEISFF